MICLAIKVVEDQESYEGASLAWDKITHSLQPEVEVLSKGDRLYFKSLIQMVMGKEIKLANIDPRTYYFFVLYAKYIFKLHSYPMLITKEFVRREVGQFVSMLGLTISKDGLGWKYGPMGFQQQHVKQEVIQPQARGGV